MLVDFGTNYKRYQQYYEEFVRPRATRGLVDLLALGILPRARAASTGATSSRAPSSPGAMPNSRATRPRPCCSPTATLTTAGRSPRSTRRSRVYATPMTLAMLRAWQETAPQDASERGDVPSREGAPPRPPVGARRRAGGASPTPAVPPLRGVSRTAPGAGGGSRRQAHRARRPSPGSGDRSGHRRNPGAGGPGRPLRVGRLRVLPGGRRRRDRLHGDLRFQDPRSGDRCIPPGSWRRGNRTS